MTSRRLYIILSLLVVWNLPLYADNELGDYATQKYSVIPPSPEVSSLMKYIDVPVSYFTGQPQIDIPIYTLTEGAISVPISLSYKGGGIKQNELSDNYYDRCDYLCSDAVQNIECDLVSSSGIILWTQKVNMNRGYCELKCPMEQLPSGLYFVICRDEYSIISTKVIKAK